MRLEDKVSIITGGGGGMGRVAAQLFAAQGAKVVVAEYSEAAGADTVDLVRAAPLWKRSLSDRSYALASVIGMTWTYLRPSLPSRNAT